jgi:predicted nucleotidyltransferase component of viral defense system
MSEIKNIPASVAARLKNVSKQSGKAFDLLLLLYLQERLLYRLSISDFNDKFVLKGGLFLFSLTQFKARPTKDMDFLAKQISNDTEYIKSAFEQICVIPFEQDGVRFDSVKVTVERIKEDADYEGIRIKIPSSLGNMRKVLQLDIGFGDVIIPKPQEIHYPVLLDMEIPYIHAYSRESVIAEKFEAMITLSVANSRMKDFYDIYTLLDRESFDGRILMEAIFETIQRRGTHLESDHPVFSDSFAVDSARVRQWYAFLKRTGIEETLPFDKVMTKLRAFLEPIYLHVLKEEEFFGEWDIQDVCWR